VRLMELQRTWNVEAMDPGMGNVVKLRRITNRHIAALSLGGHCSSVGSATAPRGVSVQSLVWHRLHAALGACHGCGPRREGLRPGQLSFKPK
jgi:Fe-S cluster biogenesis protein NfuA